MFFLVYKWYINYLDLKGIIDILGFIDSIRKDDVI